MRAGRAVVPPIPPGSGGKESPNTEEHRAS